MTVATSTSKSGPYAGAGTTGPFTVDFRFLENAHLLVVKTTAAGGEIPLVLGSDYTVTGAGAAAGTVTLAAALAGGETLTVLRNVPATQEADYVQNEAFPAESHERALDKLTMLVQQISEGNGRNLKLAVSTPAGVLSTVQPPVPNGLLGWDQSGTRLENKSVSNIATIVAYGTAKADIFTGDGVQTDFILTSSPGAQANLDVAVGGVTQLPSTDYTWPGGALVVFSTAPPLGAKVLIRYLQALPQGVTDSAASTFIQRGVGAVTRTAQEKMRETAVSVTDFTTIKADGTDQTAAIVGWFGSLGAAYTGIIKIPFGVKCNFTAVCAAMPPGMIISDESCINAWYTGGYKQNLVGYTDLGKADGSVDLQFRISSGHNAGLILDNRGTAGSNSGNVGVASYIWARGQFTKVAGQEGVRSLARMEWSQIPGGNKWWFIWRREIPWVARIHEYWYPNMAYALGDHIRNENGIYRALNSGVTGSTAPTGLKGSSTVDGGITWFCVDRSIDQGIFIITETGEIATNTSPADGVVAYLKASAEGDGGAELRLEATGNSKTAAIRFNPTSAAGVVNSSMPLIFAQDGVGLRIAKNDVTIEYVRFSENGGMQFGAHSMIEGLVTNNSATPSVTGIGLLRLANTAPTSLTGLSGNLTTQIVRLWAENGNTTLVHNASSFVLKGGVNAVLLPNQVVDMQKYSPSGAWFEVNRNF